MPSKNGEDDLDLNEIEVYSAGELIEKYPNARVVELSCWWSGRSQTTCCASLAAKCSY